MDGLALVGILGMWIAFEYMTIRNDKRHIQKHLSRKGASKITVDWDWGGGNRGNHAYHVIYFNQQGARCYTHCKVGVWGGEIYWMESPEV